MIMVVIFCCSEEEVEEEEESSSVITSCSRVSPPATIDGVVESGSLVSVAEVWWAKVSAVVAAAAAVEKDDDGEIDLFLEEEGESVAAVVVLDPIRKLDNKDRGEEEFSRFRCCCWACWVVDVVVVVKEGQDPYDGRSR